MTSTETTRPPVTPASTEFERRFDTDSPIIDGEAILSGANFREVSPEIISPLSFSLIGGGMERAFRELAATTGQRTGGDRPSFVGYIGFRPFHVMSNLDEVVARLPIMRRNDVWELLLGGTPPTMTRPAVSPRSMSQARNGFRAARLLLHGNGQFADLACELVADAEAHVDALRHGRQSRQVGAALERSFEACRHAWALHTRTTTLATGTASALRAVLRRDHDDATATEVLRQVARRASEATHASASPSRLSDPDGRLQSYEVADQTDRFSPFGLAASKPTSMLLDVRRPVTEELALITSSWTGHVALKVTTLLETLLAERERSKELGLRALHAVRMALDSEAFDLDIADAAMLSSHELVNLQPRDAARTIERRAAELDEAVAIDIAADLREVGERLVAIERPQWSLEAGAHGTPLAPGWATGTLVTEAEAVGNDDDIVYGARVDGNYVLAARPAGVVTTYGSLLSHVAIVCRELGIPLVSNIGFDAHLVGRAITVDGWSGEVST